MPEQRIVDILNLQPRFLRSTHLERDFYDPTALAGYVVTDFALSALTRIKEGLKRDSGERAWRITGHYGAGKSSFALVLAHTFAGRESTLPPQIRRVVDLRGDEPPFVSVLVTCAREPLALSVFRGLVDVVQRIYGRRTNALVTELRRRAKSNQPVKDDELLGFILRLNTQLIVESRARGLVLILDELGKALEFAALHPGSQDVFLLQRLAETATRSSGEPLFVVSLLHQGFSAYADSLDQATEREWEKVAGRFDEIVFDQPLQQVGELIASALAVSQAKIPKSQASDLGRTAKRLLELGWFGHLQTKDFTSLAQRLYPLHPSVLPVLLRTFRRFGQNERSLFSFLLSSEPFGLQEFAQANVKAKQLYRLHNFFDYVRANFGYRLAVQTYRSNWNLIASMIDSFAADDELSKRILKTIGILNLLDDDDLSVTSDSLALAITDYDSRRDDGFTTALRNLRSRKRAVWDRGARGFCLWPHSSVNLDKAYDDARRKLPPLKRIGSFIEQFLERRPIVARRHYIQTGNLRHCEVRYCSLATLTAAPKADGAIADGFVLVPLCETAKERAAAMAFAVDALHKEQQTVLIAVPQPLNSLATLIEEARRWEWVSTNVLELNADKYAREEVARQKEAARLQLKNRLESFVGFQQFRTETSLTWFYRGRKQTIKNGRQLLHKLSDIFDAVYPSAPIIQNELVNRRDLSSAAAAARARLLERIVARSTEPWLGMDAAKSPPEMSMYLSVLRNTGLHRDIGGIWQIEIPEGKKDVCGISRVLRRVGEIVQSNRDARVNVETIFEELRRPPFGIRNGVLPVFLAIFAVVHNKDLAFYKDGTFLRELSGEEMLLLTKNAARFDVQFCQIQGVRTEVFERLVGLLQISGPRHRKVELIEIVQRLCIFIAELPPYVRNTKRLSQTAIMVRDAILKAREPATLVFADLPQACGCRPITNQSFARREVSVFIETLRSALDELRIAYARLEERLRNHLRITFELPGSFDAFRRHLAERAEQVLLNVREPKLRAFCLRLADNVLSEAEWLESLGSYLALRPPPKWQDTDEDFFDTALLESAAKFHRVESIVFSSGRKRDDMAIRLAVTRSDGHEHDRVVHFSADERESMLTLQHDLEGVLAENPRLGLAAASQAIWNTLERTRSHKNGE